MRHVLVTEASRFVFGGKRGRGRRRPGTIPLHLERLEVRAAMTANDPSTSPPMPSISIDPAVEMPRGPIYEIVHHAAASSAQDSRFGSQEALENWIMEAAVARWKHLFGRPDYPIWRCGGLQISDRSGGVNFMPMAVNASAPTAGISAALSSWTANAQVAGVDEIDLVETDGTYLYEVSGSTLVIVGGLREGQPRVVSRIELDPAERPLGIYLSGGRLAVVSANDGWSSGCFPTPFARASLLWSCEPPAPPRTVVTVFDIADRSAPTLVQRTSMDGTLVTSRVVDGELRIVLKSGFDLPPLNRVPIDPWSGDAPVLDDPMVGGVEDSSPVPFIAVMPAIVRRWGDGWWRPTSRFETEAEYLARIRGGVIDGMMPMVRSLDGAGNVLATSPLVSAVDVWHGEPGQCRNLTVLATFDLAGDTMGPMDTVGVFTSGDLQVYATSDSVFLFDARWAAAGLRTDVRKFTFSSQTHGIELTAQGEFGGRLLNQFAVDEHDGRLRVVVEGLPDGHGVHVLESHGAMLEVTGSVTGLAAGESLYAVRFAGDRAYLVTFRRVDPLFVVDFTDPLQPAVRGVLHVPGFSDALLPIDDTHLLAVGRCADERTGFFGDLQISLFDVSDPGDPRLLDRYAFAGGRSTTTPLTGDRWIRGDGDPMAARYDAASGIFTLPVELDGFMPWWAAEGSSDSASVVTGLHTFRIDPRGRIEPLGVITHSELVTRSVSIGDKLVAVSADAVSVHEASDPRVCIGTVDTGGIGGTPLRDVAVYHRSREAQSVDVVETSANGAGESTAAAGRETTGTRIPDAGWFAIQADAQANGLAAGAGSVPGSPRGRFVRPRMT